jgi:ribonuclease PH
MARIDGRLPTDLRPISFELGVQKHVAGSALIKWGDTHVLCAATVEDRVPPFVEEGGWVSAEYALLPGSTHSRVRRDRKGPSGRTAEIQRLIGRSLRGALDLKRLDGVSLTIDCDVIQADGGTRCASITGAYVAASIALKQLGYHPEPFAAVSFGLVNGELLTDLCYHEDSQAEVDMNIVLSTQGLIEVQGTAERKPFSSSQLMEMVQRAEVAAQHIFEIQKNAIFS